MLTKLLKYECRASGRQILPLCVVMVGWSVIARLLLMLRVSLPWPQIEQLMSGLLITGCALILFGGSCAAWVFLLLRYYRGLYGGEGYLVHTLPTSATNLLWAKLLAALLWELCVGLSLILSLAILGAGTQVMNGFFGLFSLIWRNANELFASATLVTLTFELLVLIPLTIVSGILLAYAAISLGQRMRENRVLGAVGAYIALSFGINMVFGVANTVVGVVSAGLSDFSPELSMVVLIGAQVVLIAVQCVGCFLFCRWSLSKKLELA